MAVKSIDPPGILQLLSSSSPPSSSSSFIHCTCTCLPRKSHYYTNCCREESLLPRRQRVVVISQAWVITTAGHREVSEREREQWTQDLRRRNGCCTAKRATFWDSFDGFNHHQPAMGAIIIVVIFFSPTQKSGWIFHRKVVNGRWYLFWKKTIEPVFPRVATDLSCHTVEKRRKNNIIILCATLKRRAFFAWLSVILGNTSRTSKINKVEYLVVLRHHQANFVLTDRTHHHHSTSLALKWQKGWWNDWNSSFSSSRSEAKSLTLSLFLLSLDSRHTHCKSGVLLLTEDVLMLLLMLRLRRRTKRQQTKAQFLFIYIDDDHLIWAMSTHTTHKHTHIHSFLWFGRKDWAQQRAELKTMAMTQTPGTQSPHLRNSLMHPKQKASFINSFTLHRIIDRTINAANG